MPGTKPNILVIWGDDIGTANLSCYSHGVMCYRTPNIDRLAAEADPTDPGSYQRDGFRCVGTALDTPLPSALFSCRAGDRASVAFIRT